MGLKIKSMDEVFNNLVDWITSKTDKISDFNVGSAIRTLTESIALQFEEFYYDMKQNILYGIENSIYTAFGFEQIISTAATGNVTVTFTKALPDSLTFPKGTKFCTSGTYGYLYYESTADYIAPLAATSCEIAVQCLTTGTVGNIPIGAITTIVTTNNLIESVSNNLPFTNGTDDETSSERKKRFQTYINTLSRGTADAIVYGALTVDGVAGAVADDSYVGFVRLYIHDSNGDAPVELKNKVSTEIKNYRAAGIEVEVLSVVRTTVDLDLKIILSDDYTPDIYKDSILNTITTILNDYTVGENLYIADVIHQTMNIYDEIIVNIIVNSGKDMAVAKNELLRAGTVTIECINVKDWRS